MADAPEAFPVFGPGMHVWLVPPRTGAAREATITGIRGSDARLIVALDTVNDVGAASVLVGCTLLAEASVVPDSPDVHPDDMTGWTVCSEAEGLLGTIDDVIITGANDVWVVNGRLGQVLIPVIDDVVVAYDEDARSVEVALLDGLLEDDR